MKYESVECHLCGHTNIIEFDPKTEDKIKFNCYSCREVLEYDIEPIITHKLILKELNYTHCINCKHQILKSLVKKRKARGEILDKLCTGCYNKTILETNTN